MSFALPTPPFCDTVVGAASACSGWLSVFAWGALVALLLLAVGVAAIALRFEPAAWISWLNGRRRARARAAPIVRFLTLLESINEAIGRSLAWVVVVMLLVQFTLVVMRYVFSLGSIAMQESVWYMHGLLFTLGAGYTLLHDEHVRLDLFYRRQSARVRAWINLLGACLALMPFCLVIISYAGSFVASAWAVREGSTEVSGLEYLWLLKTAILTFAVLLLLEGLAIALRAVACLRGIWPGDDPIEESR